MWVPVMKFRQSGFEASLFTHGAISQTLVLLSEFFFSEERNTTHFSYKTAPILIDKPAKSILLL